jgi:hypothetical protein
MKTLIRFVLMAVLGIVVITSCKKDASKGKASRLDSLKYEIDSLTKAADLAWDTMIAEDNKKLDYLKRMVDEAVYVLNVSEVDKNKLHQDIEALRKFRYDRQTMYDSELIDAYDSATDSTIRMILTFIDSVEGNDIPLIDTLIKDIRNLDEMVIHRRGYYDEPAIALNRLLKERKRQLKKLGEPYASMNPYPLFSLNPDL